MKIQKLTVFIIWVSVFSLSMGFLESAVVIYLREIYYPHGFHFPLVAIEHNIALIEFVREVATLIMLITIGYISGTSFSSRFAWFIYSFAIWDICYYIFLKLLVDWPNSFMTYDILFLVPFVWIGPVITPIIISLTMIVLALSILIYDNRKITTRINSVEWAIFVIGSLIIVIGFSWDYAIYLIENNCFSDFWSLSDNAALFKTADEYVPQKFNWFLFILGEIILLLGITKYRTKLKRLMLQ